MFQQSFKFNFTVDSYNLSVFEDNKKYDLSCDGLKFSVLKENGIGVVEE